MKKTVYIMFLLLLVTGLVFGQNSATSTQSGNTNAAVIEQNGGHTATTTQTGDLNDAAVTQNGSGASATVTQSSIGTSAHDGAINEATVNQTGSGTASIVQNQFGSGDFGGSSAEGNIGKVTQVGAGSIAEIYQAGRNEEFGAGWAGYPDLGKGAFIDQNGNSNTAKIRQDGAANKTTIDQVSDGNWATSMLLMSGSNLNTASISQNGTGNIADQTGDGSGSFRKNSFSVTQTGNSNIADQRMQGDLGSWAGGNTQRVVQTGSGNTADQDLINPVSTVNGNSQRISQLSDGNSAVQIISDHSGWQYHNGANNTEIIEQSGGTGNSARQEQRDIDNGYSKIVQTGSSNTAVIRQVTPSATGSSMSLTQDGDINIAHLDQTGGGSGTILQNGDGNRVKGLDLDPDPAIASFSGPTLSISQTGNSNIVNMNANGIVSVTQMGNSNIATVSQQ